MKHRCSVQSLAGSTFVLLLGLVVAAPTAARAEVLSVTLSPATITGGTGGSSTGTVSIGPPAPAGGRRITLTSSNTDLAASTQSIVVPEGATSATFTVGTNALHRPYSGLAFDAIITATDPGDGSSASALLHVTAQVIPGPFAGSTVSTDARAQAGRMCGASFGTGGAKERGILYRCEFPQAGQFSVCRFQQECSLGCQTQAASGLNRQDVCATTPPFPIAVNPELLEGGRRSDGAVFLSAPANSLTSAYASVSPGGEIAPGGNFPVPQGSTTAPFDLDTFEVAVPSFLQFRADLSLNPQERFAQDYLAVVPAPGPEPQPGSLAVFSVDTTPMVVVQGLPSIGAVILNGVAPSGGVVVSLSTDSTAASVPATVTVEAGQTATSFGVTTFGVSQVTPVRITATLGGSRSTTMTVSPFVFSTTMPALADLSVSPATVIAGTRSIGRVRVTGPAPDPSDGAVSVALTSSNEAAVVVSRNVTVGYGGTFADFRIRTFAVAQSTVVTLRATFNGVTRSATLTVNSSGSGPPPPPPPPPTPTVSSLTLNPATVTGGSSSAGTVALSAAAPSGGTAVSLSTSSPAASTPSSITVPAGATSATFTVTTISVPSSTVVTVTGTSGGTSRTANLTVTPPGGGGGGGDTGLRSPTANTVNSGGDGNGFESSPANAHGDDALSAVDTNSGTGSSTSCTGTSKDKHRFSTFGFTFPAGVSIRGIEVRLDARADSTSSSPKMCVQLSWDGGSTWTSAKSTPTLGTSMGTFTLGSAVDTWGRSWTTGNVSDSNFRVRVINVSSSSSRDFSLDWVAVRVHYE